MKQVTEFTGFLLQNAAQGTDELLKTPEGESDEAKATRRQALEAKIGETTKLEGERLARLADGVTLFAAQSGKVRLLRVFKAGEAPSNAKPLGEFAYVVEMVTDSSRPARGDHKRRGGGGRGRDEGGGKKTTEGDTLRGSFSMDSLKDDRKNRLATDGKGRGGPGGRRGPGGPRGPGGDNRGPRGPGGENRGPGGPRGPGGDTRGPRGPGGAPGADARGPRPDNRGPGGPRGPGGDNRGPRPQGAPRPGQRGPRPPVQVTTIPAPAAAPAAPVAPPKAE